MRSVSGQIVFKHCRFMAPNRTLHGHCWFGLILPRSKRFTPRMNGVSSKPLFFLGLPDLNQLVCVTLSLQEHEDQEPRTNQVKACRELVLLNADILACPAVDSITDITAVMAVQFFQRGFLQAFAVRNRLQLGCPQRVFPGDLQCCLSYSLISRLAPKWNKAGLYLISGDDFLTERGRLSAVSMELSTSEGRLCISIEANAVRLPPPTLEDFELPALVIRRFCSDSDSILDPSSTGRPIWCHVLPSMKKGQIITISRQLPRDGPFRTYRDLQNHWNRLYGYRLPDLGQEEVVYCSIYFKPVGERLFTYPLSCIRLQPVQRCPRGDLQGALGCFLCDIRDRLQSVCGFPARLTSKPSYRTVQLSSAASLQVLSRDQINLTHSISTRPILTQLPEPPLSQPLSSFSSRLEPPWISLSQQGGAEELLGKKSWNTVRQSGEDWSSSSLSSNSQNLYQLDHSRSGSSFYQHFQPASSLPVPPPHALLSPVPVNSSPKLVPIFRNKEPSHRINVALLRAQKQEQLSGRREDKPRIALPVTVGLKTAVPAASSSFSAVSLPLPPRIVPRFNHRPKNLSSSVSQPSGRPKVNHISSLSPISRVKPVIIIPSKSKTRFSKTSEKVGPERNAEPWKTPGRTAGSERIVPKSIMKTSREAETNRPPLTSGTISTKDTSISRKNKVVFELKEEKPQKPKASVQDVEKMARSNQLSKLSSTTLLLWLKQRGVQVAAKHRKEELMVKVMSCLAEA
ncbi:hypothetical protein ILYODFUR_002511 [Ilyodon furcidens]|uniref:DUF4708 domain-containing protein n=1 Tax=Ilyodon furcidens TaxID=33524 RepID=A0ABV0UGS3_9TELE